MTNAEIRMANEAPMSNDERTAASTLDSMHIRHSDFVIVSSFGNSSFVIGARVASQWFMARH
jgi:hypothetical protein